MSTKTIFIAFTGPRIQQPVAVHRISAGYECWDLEKFQFDDFLSAVQQRIPPMNENVLRNYKRDGSAGDTPFGITSEDYAKCSWALLLPDLVPDSLGNGYAEILFLLSLYSPHFLNPVFYLSDFGIYRPDHREHYLFYFHDQNQSERFKRPEFVQFYETLVSESGYGIWQAYRMAGWDREDMRLFVACLLFNGLRESEHSKYAFTWQKESADMATILEALFTAGSGENTEIGYKLRKRVAALLAFQFPDIEKEIQKLYRERSEFVHGAFFLRIRKGIEIKDGLAKLPAPPFTFLYGYKERIRFALIAYMHLNKARKSGSGDFKDCASVLDILERAIIDLDTRAKIRANAEAILKLM